MAAPRTHSGEGAPIRGSEERVQPGARRLAKPFQDLPGIGHRLGHDFENRFGAGGQGPLALIEESFQFEHVLSPS